MVSVMVPPVGTVVAGLNTSTGCMAAPETPPEVMEEKKMTPDTLPDATPADAATSASVCTVMPVALPAFALPIVKPLRVMVKAVFAAMPAFAVVMTMEVAPGAVEVAGMIATDVVPAALFAGVAVVAKNPTG